MSPQDCMHVWCLSVYLSLTKWHTRVLWLNFFTKEVGKYIIGKVWRSTTRLWKDILKYWKNKLLIRKKYFKKMLQDYHTCVLWLHTLRRWCIWILLLEVTLPGAGVRVIRVTFRLSIKFVCSLFCLDAFTFVPLYSFCHSSCFSFFFLVSLFTCASFTGKARWRSSTFLMQSLPGTCSLNSAISSEL